MKINGKMYKYLVIGMFKTIINIIPISIPEYPLISAKTEFSSLTPVVSKMIIKQV